MRQQSDEAPMVWGQRCMILSHGRNDDDGLFFIHSINIELYDYLTGCWDPSTIVIYKF